MKNIATQIAIQLLLKKKFLKKDHSNSAAPTAPTLVQPNQKPKVQACMQKMVFPVNPRLKQPQKNEIQQKIKECRQMILAALLGLAANVIMLFYLYY